ncbi:MAG: hypothetical protein JW982_15670 [Spirochaetes bacterium]|nr:hypothetical protein [Spirochaetota bacterium]
MKRRILCFSYRKVISKFEVADLLFSNFNVSDDKFEFFDSHGHPVCNDKISYYCYPELVSD